MSGTLAGIYRHYKGQHYLVLGLASDSNADDLHEQVWTPTNNMLGDESDWSYRRLRERRVVVYVGLELDGASPGPRMHVRTFGDFVAWVHHDDGTPCDATHHYVQAGCVCDHGRQVGRRFTFIGETWDGAA